MKKPTVRFYFALLGVSAFLTGCGPVVSDSVLESHNLRGFEIPSDTHHELMSMAVFQANALLKSDSQFILSMDSSAPSFSNGRKVVRVNCVDGGPNQSWSWVEDQNTIDVNDSLIDSATKGLFGNVIVASAVSNSQKSTLFALVLLHELGHIYNKDFGRAESAFSMPTKLGANVQSAAGEFDTAFPMEKRADEFAIEVVKSANFQSQKMAGSASQDDTPATVCMLMTATCQMAVNSWIIDKRPEGFLLLNTSGKPIPEANHSNLDLRLLKIIRDLRPQDPSPARGQRAQLSPPQILKPSIVSKTYYKFYFQGRECGSEVDSSIDTKTKGARTIHGSYFSNLSLEQPFPIHVNSRMYSTETPSGKLLKLQYDSTVMGIHKVGTAYFQPHWILIRVQGLKEPKKIPVTNQKDPILCDITAYFKLGNQAGVFQEFNPIDEALISIVVQPLPDEVAQTADGKQRLRAMSVVDPRGTIKVLLRPDLSVYSVVGPEQIEMRSVAKL